MSWNAVRQASCSDKERERERDVRVSELSAGQRRLQLVGWFPAAQWSNFSTSSRRNRSERLHLVHEEGGGRLCALGSSTGRALINIFRAIHAAAAEASVETASSLAGFHLKT